MPATTDGRPDPDGLLQRIQAEEHSHGLGRLKVFLGYASGVGKSFRMLDEGRRRKKRGEDVVIGALQSKMDGAVEKLLPYFEIIQPLRVDGQDVMDLRAILERRPQVCLVDNLARDHPPRCRNARRYQDVQELREAGISIITAVNLQHIEELRAQVEPLTGKKVTETIPKGFLTGADEIEIVDVPPEQLLERLGRQPDQAAKAAERGRLSELREIALLLAAEVVDRQANFEEMDTEGILARKPGVCLVDEFAHTNVPGSERTKRWEDVFVLLDAGMDVITTMNIQHLESINDQVRQITGIQVRETVPDWAVKRADQIVMVDLTPAALIHRLQRGAVYAPEKASRALENFFKESNLVALREIALRQAAHEVDVRQATGTQGQTTAGEAASAAEPGASWTLERFLVYVTDQPSTANLIRRAWRVAEYLQAECFAVHVRRPFESQSHGEAVEKHLKFARDLHIETRVLEGEDLAETLVQFARVQRVTHIFMARARYTLWQRFPGVNPIHKVVRRARDMRLTIVAERRS